MKTFFVLLFLSVLFSASTCKKEGANCHKNIYIRNNSDSTVIFALNSYYDDKCLLYQEDILLPNEQADLDIRICWENELSNGKTQDIYIVDPQSFNENTGDPSQFYSCDSIIYKNKILKHYNLTLNDLKSTDFVVTYP